MPDLFPPTLEDVVGEIERELRFRAQVYPRLIESGRLTKARAERQTALLAEALHILKVSKLLE